MMTFEEYYDRQGVIYRRNNPEYVISGREFSLAELLKSVGDVDHNDVWLEAEWDCNNIEVTLRVCESDKEFEERKLSQYENYVQGEDARQQREIEEYKRLHAKYGENK